LRFIIIIRNSFIPYLHSRCVWVLWSN